MTHPFSPIKSHVDKFRKFIGVIIAAIISAFMVMIFASLLFTTKDFTTSSSSLNLAHLVRMGLIQASLSTILSLGVGIGLAWSLNRLTFWGRSFIISILATAIVAPGLVVALGLIKIWGRAGWVNDTLSILNLQLPGSIFGFHGILLAHVILNGAFAAHILLARLETIPAQKLKTGRSLNMNSLTRFLTLDWPMISNALPALSSIIFLLTFTSFPIVLLLGGGPANQTLEVAIFSAIRLNFDLQGAVILSVIQLVICAIIIIPSLISSAVIAPAGITRAHYWPDSKRVKRLQTTIITLSIFGFALPFLAILTQGLGSGLIDTLSRPRFWQAATTSLTLGLVSTALTLLLAIRIAMARNALNAPLTKALVGLPMFAYLVIPSLVLAFGFFLGLKFLRIPHDLAAPFVLITANVLLALPFVFATIAPPLESIVKRYTKLSTSLNLSGFTRWKLVERPLMGREIGIASALAFCFSLGDLGVISLFGTQDFTTLPWLMYRALGAYRTHEAASIAALMLMICFIAFWALPLIFNEIHAMFEIKNLSFCHPGQAIPLVYNFCSMPSTISAITGPSGIGKSTLLDLIAGFLTPVSGAIRLNEVNIISLPPEKRPVSILFQADNLFEHLSVQTNLELGLPKSSNRKAKLIKSALKEVGLDGYETRRASDLSGGQKQRVALARTLLRNQPIVLLDEPFANLDENTARDMRALVKRLTRKNAWHTLLVTHNPTDVKDLADRIYPLGGDTTAS